MTAATLRVWVTAPLAWAVVRVTARGVAHTAAVAAAVCLVAPAGHPWPTTPTEPARRPRP